MWRKKDIGGDSHVMSPKMIAELQKVARDGGQKNFENYRKLLFPLLAFLFSYFSSFNLFLLLF